MRLYGLLEIDLTFAESAGELDRDETATKIADLVEDALAAAAGQIRAGLRDHYGRDLVDATARRAGPQAVLLAAELLEYAIAETGDPES